MNFELPDIRANQAERHENIKQIIGPAPTHHADTVGMAQYIAYLEKQTVKANKKNIGVEREIDILLQVIDDLEPDRKIQKQLIKEAAKKVPMPEWLRLQLIKKYEEECLAEAKRKEK